MEACLSSMSQCREYHNRPRPRRIPQSSPSISASADPAILCLSPPPRFRQISQSAPESYTEKTTTGLVGSCSPNPPPQPSASASRIPHSLPPSTAGIILTQTDFTSIQIFLTSSKQFFWLSVLFFFGGCRISSSLDSSQRWVIFVFLFFLFFSSYVMKLSEVIDLVSFISSICAIFIARFGSFFKFKFKIKINYVWTGCIWVFCQCTSVNKMKWLFT